MRDSDTLYVSFQARCLLKMNMLRGRLKIRQGEELYSSAGAAPQLSFAASRIDHELHLFGVSMKCICSIFSAKNGRMGSLPAVLVLSK